MMKILIILVTISFYLFSQELKEINNKINSIEKEIKENNLLMQSDEPEKFDWYNVSGSLRYGFMSQSTEFSQIDENDFPISSSNNFNSSGISMFGLIFESENFIYEDFVFGIESGFQFYNSQMVKDQAINYSENGALNQIILNHNLELTFTSLILSPKANYYFNSNYYAFANPMLQFVLFNNGLQNTALDPLNAIGIEHDLVLAEASDNYIMEKYNSSVSSISTMQFSFIIGAGYQREILDKINLKFDVGYQLGLNSYSSEVDLNIGGFLMNLGAKYILKDTSPIRRQKELIQEKKRLIEQRDKLLAESKLKEEKKVEPEPAKVPENTGDDGDCWSVKYASSFDKNEIEEIASQLRSVGFDVTTEEFKTISGDFSYRVKTGCWNDRNDAIQAYKWIKWKFEKEKDNIKNLNKISITISK